MFLVGLLLVSSSAHVLLVANSSVARSDILIRAIGMRAHALHSVSFFSLLCVIAGGVGRVFISLREHSVIADYTLYRMILNKTPIVVPDRLVWLGMLAMIGIFGFAAQVGIKSPRI